MESPTYSHLTLPACRVPHHSSLHHSARHDTQHTPSEPGMTLPFSAGSCLSLELPLKTTSPGSLPLEVALYFCSTSMRCAFCPLCTYPIILWFVVHLLHGIMKFLDWKCVHFYVLDGWPGPWPKADAQESSEGRWRKRGQADRGRGSEVLGCSAPWNY